MWPTKQPLTLHLPLFHLKIKPLTPSVAKTDTYYSPPQGKQPSAISRRNTDPRLRGLTSVCHCGDPYVSVFISGECISGKAVLRDDCILNSSADVVCMWAAGIQRTLFKRCETTLCVCFVFKGYLKSTCSLMESGVRCQYTDAASGVHLQMGSRSAFARSL